MISLGVAVAKSSANGLVDAEFVSRFRLQTKSEIYKAQVVGLKPLQPLLSD